MYNWKNSFSKTVLARGLQYYKSGRVRNIKQSGNSYTAVIKGTYNYDVTFKLTDNNKAYLTCECPYAADGFRCKHMAALLYAIEDKLPPKSDAPAKSPKTAEPLTPFARDISSPGTFFNLAEFGNILTVTPDLYMKAKKLINTKSFELSSVNTLYSVTLPKESCILNARGKDAAGIFTEIKFSRNKIISLYCDCSYKYHYSEYRFYSENVPVKMCEHMTALCILTDDYIKKNNPGDATNRSGKIFLGNFRRYEKALRNQKTLTDDKIILQPRVELRYGDTLSASFKTGFKKLYVVKSPEDFITAAEAKGVYTLGKTAEIDFASARFEEKSFEYYNFIKQYNNHRRAYEQDKFSDSLSKASSNFTLSGIMLDKFFDISIGEKTEFTGSSHTKEKSKLSYAYGMPSIELILRSLYSQKNGSFEGVNLSGTLPDLIKGAEYNYFVELDTLYRISNEDYEKIRPYYDASYYTNFNINIGQHNLSEFYYSILPNIRKTAKVIEKDSGDAEAVLPPEVEFKFYLDLEDGIPVCKACAYYGEVSCNIIGEYAPDITAYRNTYREEQVLETVKEYFPNRLDDERFAASNSEEAVFSILQNGIKDLLEYGEVHSTDKFDSLKVQRKMKITVGVSIQSNLMDLTIDTEDIPHSELLDILNSYKLKKRYHRLRSGEFVTLDESVEELYELTQALKIPSKDFLKENIQVPAYRALYLDKMLEKYDSIYSERDRQFRKFVKEFKTVSESDFEIPKNLQKTMRDYQKFGHKWIRTVSGSGFGGILADDMGLGKTLQIISVLSALKSEGSKSTSLVICPASLVYNWLEEFKKYAPEMSVCLIVGTAEERQKLIKKYQSYDVIITSYDLLKRDIAAYENITFEYQILDEAQNIKNHATVASKSVKIINAKMKFALTGTPIENRLGELWSIFDFLMPGFLYGYDTFRRDFEVPIVKNGDKDAEARLKSMVNPFILRRLKKDVLKDLPDKIEEIRYAKFESTQQKLYDGQAVHMMNMLSGQSDESFKKEKIQILAELTRIRRICCDPSLVFENYEGTSAKKEACLDLIETAIEGGHKILLFSQFVSMLEILEKELRNKKINYYKITGETEKKERLELVQKFNSDTTPVFLISLKAGGTGLNLTGADVVIHYDPWWNVAAQNQATDRAHRIGQKRIVSVYKLIAKNTIEERISELQTAKQELADAIVGENTAAFSSLTRDDIMKIIGVDDKFRHD